MLHVVSRRRREGAQPRIYIYNSLFRLYINRWESSNPVHGRTSNPYDTNRIVGGSSGGEGCLQVSNTPFGYLPGR